MRYLFIIAVIASILAPNVSKLVIILNFHLNREHIAKTLCVQKDVEDNCCQGSCHLKKQLVEQEEKEQMPSFPVFKDKSEIQLFFQKIQGADFNILVPDHLSFLPYQTTDTVSYAFSVFHPPKA